MIKFGPWWDLSRYLRNPQDEADIDNYGFLHTGWDERFDNEKYPKETRQKAVVKHMTC